MTPYLGEIRIFAGAYAPQPDWHFCDGSLLQVSQYQALFALLGTIYGGDGVNTFGLPNLCGRVNIGAGNGATLTQRKLGQSGGSETVALVTSNMPAHSHTLNTAGSDAASPTLGATVTFANATGQNTMYIKDGLPDTTAIKENPAAGTITQSGSGQPHDNIMPGLAVNYIIALNGLFPQA